MLFFSHKCGQLGNRLFAFGHLVAYAKANKVQIVNLSFEEYADYFHSTRQDVLCRFPAKASSLHGKRLRAILFLINRVLLKSLRTLRFTRSFVHQVIIADLPEYRFEEFRFFELNSPTFNSIAKAKPVVLLFGRFFRDFKNFEKHQDEIRSFFRPCPEIQSNVEKFVSRLRQDQVTLVGVHIRRGDYKEFAGGKYFYNDAEYCRKMTELKQNTNNAVRFLICSNEVIDLKNFPGLDCVAGPGDMAEDLFSFAACDLLMGPPSTFTKWASFYGKVPLLQLEHLADVVTPNQFVILPPEKLYNF